MSDRSSDTDFCWLLWHDQQSTPLIIINVIFSSIPCTTKLFQFLVGASSLASCELGCLPNNDRPNQRPNFIMKKTGMNTTRSGDTRLSGVSKQGWYIPMKHFFFFNGYKEMFSKNLISIWSINKSILGVCWNSTQFFLSYSKNC